MGLRGGLTILASHFNVIVLKRGAAGARAQDREGRAWQAQVPPVDAIDSTGAGDIFLAAFLAAQLSGEPVAACLTRAVEAGAYAVTIVGGWPID